MRDELHSWYLVNKRDLPWRNTINPYKIWLSEIILQQTRVVQGTKYYQNFLEKFPTINHLARATEDDVLKLWQGLGYYSRARNLHFTANYIVKELGGKFPIDYNSILKLKGIGPYTAAAISSIAFHLPYPAVDGNIYRVLSRYFGIKTPIDSTQGKKEFQNIAEEIMPPTDPGFHNQAMMEFGALQCTPKSPDCNICPLRETCFALNYDLVHKLPVKSKKQRQIKRYFNYYCIENKNSIYLEKRTANDIWKNLYQFPLYESANQLSDTEIINSEIPILSHTNFNIKSISPVKKHILSHQIIYARVIYVEIKESIYSSDELIHVNRKDISKFAVPRLLEQFIEDLQID